MILKWIREHWEKNFCHGQQILAVRRVDWGCDKNLFSDNVEEISKIYEKLYLLMYNVKQQEIRSSG